ncbi:MAG: hypothetical protein NTY94_04935 [Alphaproteobacteria bacterium]|nr:hypothetical protein [Alphaproteobacteria bacterium]
MSGQHFLASDPAAQGLPQVARGRHGMLGNGMRAAAALSGRLGAGTPRSVMFLAVGAAAAVVALMFAGGRSAQPPRIIQQASAPAPVLSTAASTPGITTQFTALEGRIQALEAALAERGTLTEQATARAEDAARAARLASETAAQAASQASAALAQARPQDRLVPALLNLQMVAATARPWHRELRALLDLDAGRHIPPPVVEVLTSHSLRGVPTEGELHDRFVALIPAIAWRMPAEHGVLDRAQLNMRAALSGIGLIAPPPPGEADAATASIAERLRRGDLAGAVADAAALDKRAEPLLVGWMAQARARLAVEQALRETILTLLARTPSQ